MATHETKTTEYRISVEHPWLATLTFDFFYLFEFKGMPIHDTLEEAQAAVASHKAWLHELAAKGRPVPWGFTYKISEVVVETKTRTTEVHHETDR